MVLLTVQCSNHDFLFGRLLEVATRGAHERLTRRETQQLTARVRLSLLLFVGFETNLAEWHCRSEHVIIQL